MYPHHEKVFKFLASRNIRIGDLVMEGSKASVMFSVHNYSDEILFEAWKNMPHFLGESVNICLSVEGLSVALPNYNELPEDETTEVEYESRGIECEPARELEVPQTGNATAHTKAPISERFGFIL